MKTLSFFLFSLLLAGMQLANAAIIYVNDDATGANNGTSWANAFTSLQSAITASSPGDQIWVAAGTYKPINTPNGHFDIPNTVKFYGGFTGTETQLAQRDWTLNESTLSGDIGVTGVITDNASMVFHADNVTSSTRVDGFKIVSAYGYGILIENSSLTVANCTFIANAGEGLFHSGSGILNLWDCNFSNNSHGGVHFSGDQLNMAGCDISDNENTTGIGGGLFVGGIGVANINRCVFSGNIADAGGAIYVYDGGAVHIYNSLFAGNYANLIPVIFISALENFQAHTFWNCTVVNNKANNNFSIAVNAYTSIRNCIFWGDDAIDEFDDLFAVPDIANCIVEGGYSLGTNISSANPQFFQSGNGTLAPFNASSYNYRLLSNSSAINSGNNSFVSSTYNTDLDDSSRVSGSTVDMGCYEKYFCSASANITASGSTTICAGQSVTLTATSANSYSWSNGATTQSISATQQGNYSVTITDANGCIGNASKQVTVSAPTVQISGDDIVCSGQSITLSASSSGGGSYAWSSGATSSSITVSQQGTYTVTVTNSNGCTAVSSPKVVTQPQTFTTSVSAVATKTSICAGEVIQFTATPVNGGTPTYLWKKNGTSTNYTVNPYVTQYLQNGDVITAEMTSSLECVTQRTVTSNPITMTVVTCPVGIGTTTDEAISIYPNPAINEIKIEAGKEKIERIRIFNATGVLVKSIVADLITIDVSGLASGIYFLEIKFQDASRRYKFAKM